MIQQGEHSTNYSSWSTYLNSSSNIKQAPICMQKNLFQNSYCYILRITPFGHNRIKKPKNLYQKTYLIAVLNKMGHPNSLSSLNYCNIYCIFIHIMICLRWCYSKTKKWQNLQFFIFCYELDKFEMTSLDYYVFMVIVIICL